MSPRDQHLTGVFLGSHAIAEGRLSRAQLRSLGYRRLVQGVYADPALELDHRLRCRGVRAHRTELRPDEVTVVDGVPIISGRRTAWDVAALEPLGTAVAALDAMVRARSVTLPELTEMADRGAGRWGVTKVRRAVPLVDPRAESAPESRVRVALVLAGFCPVPQFEVVVGGRCRRLDLGWPEAKLALEYEGAHHFEGPQIVLDDERYADLVAAGWRIIRVSASDLRDLDGVVVRIRAALGAA
ncbi:MAG TPA: hypothetical protein VGO95_04125 [Modestobacter sp.]|nr:hypothetical protein [Modestobacter sp.]